ncbi:hypothetical protein AURDEDRAFT_141236 [Auricularia subglabra TFB-10046 SS5]|nr:hypothetical protein AURDEDRAFT_141236 [Auricularia subglabra TFB-10046 SS5]
MLSTTTASTTHKALQQRGFARCRPAMPLALHGRPSDVRILLPGRASDRRPALQDASWGGEEPSQQNPNDARVLLVGYTTRSHPLFGVTNRASQPYS